MTSDVVLGYNRLAQEVMPRTEETYNRLIELYTAEHNGNGRIDLDFEKSNQKIEDVLQGLGDKINEASNNINELTKKTEKDRNVVSKAGKYPPPPIVDTSMPRKRKFVTRTR